MKKKSDIFLNDTFTFCLIFGTLFFYAENLRSQIKSIPERFLKTEAITIHDGLSQGMVNCIYQDYLGFMWFGTLDGLNRYDGYLFTVYHQDTFDSSSISGNWITCIFEDSKKRLWIGTGLNGLNLFDRKTETFIRIQHNDATPNSISDNRILSVQEDKSGSIWVSTTSGLNKINLVKKNLKDPDVNPRNLDFTVSHIHINEKNPKEEPFTLYDETGDQKYFAPSFYIDKRGTVWISVKEGIYQISTSPDHNGVISKFDRSKFIAGKNDASSNDIYNFAEDTVNDVLYFIRKKTITAFDFKKNTFSTLDCGSINPGISRTQLIFNSGLLWEACNDGIYQYDVYNNRITRFNTKNRDQEKMIRFSNTLYKDRSGTIWVGTRGYGILKYNPRTEKFHTENCGSIIWMNATPHNEIIIQAEKLFKFFEDTAEHAWKYDPDFFNDALKSFPHPTTDIAVQAGNGVYYINIGKITEYNPGTGKVKKIDKYNASFPFFLDDENNLWFGSSDAFCMRNNNTGEITEHKYPLSKISMFPYRFLESVYCDKNNIFWLGTVSGLFRFDLKNESWKHFVNIPGDSSSLSTDVIFSICEDPLRRDDCLWIGTNGGGLNCFYKQTGNFTHFMEKDGLPNNVVYGILSDQDKNLWLSTNKGISRFSPPKSQGEKGIFKNFEEEDGLQSNEFNRNAFTKTKNGLLFFGGVNGFNYFDPKEISENAFIPNVIITDFKISNKSVKFSETKNQILNQPVFLTDKITLPYNDNMISFEFSAMDFTAPGKNTFQYTMEGFDKEWIQIGTNHSATYTNLDPGVYTFKVKGRAGNGSWNETVTSIVLNILPPYYLTWWFRLLVIIIISVIVYAGFRYRFKQALRLMEVRNRIANDLHDEIGSTLSGVYIYSEVAQKSAEEKLPETKLYLKQISVDVSNMIDALGDIVWTVNAKNDRFENIINRMRAAAVELFEARQIKLHLHLDEKLHTLKMGMEARKNFYLFYKEAINNVAKYSEAKNVFIDLNQNQQNISLKVRDDGKGFDSSVKTEGNGLINMKKRAAELNGTCEIISSPGSGTETRLIFPNS